MEKSKPGNRRAASCLLAGALGLQLLAATRAQAASLDLNLDYMAEGLSYSGLPLQSDPNGSLGLISERAGLGFIIKNIALENYQGTESTMEVGLKLQALDVAGSTGPVPAPFNTIAARYPNTNFTPWIQNAYVKVNHLSGSDWNVTLGRQAVKIGSGLVLDDDDLGFTGLSFERPLQEWGGRAYFFEPSAAGANSTGKMEVYGAGLDLALDGTFSLDEITEDDHTQPVENGAQLGYAERDFFGSRYYIQNEQFAFDGEAWLERGVADPLDDGPHYAYNGEAGLLDIVWKQPMGRWGDGQVRVTVGQGSGASAGDPGGDFDPTYGHQYDGLDRDGYGDIFGATLFDAIGPSTSTANGLPPGTSGIRVIRMGVTLPAYHRIVPSFDYYLYQSASSLVSDQLGDEFDIHLTRSFGERLKVLAGLAFFDPGSGLSGVSSVTRFSLKLSGRF